MKAPLFVGLVGMMLCTGVLASPESLLGKWVLSSGEIVDRPCPVEADYRAGKAVKLPSGCKSPLPGVWLAVPQFTEGKVATATLEAKATTLQGKLDRAGRALKDLQLKSVKAINACTEDLSRAATALEGCSEEHSFFGPVGVGVILGVSLCSATVYMGGHHE